MNSFSPLNYIRNLVFNGPQTGFKPQHPQKVNDEVFVQIVTRAVVEGPTQRAPVQNAQYIAAYNNFKLQDLSLLQQNALIKDLINVPKDYKDFLYLMASNQNNVLKNDIIALLSKNLNLSQMCEFFQNNSKDALQKLVQLIAEASRSGANTTQLKELMTILGNSVSIGASNQSLAKSIMLLYLPWLPIGENTEFNIDDIACGKDAKTNKEQSLNIMISTVNLGNVNALLSLDESQKIFIDVSVSKIYPKDELKTQITEFSKENNLNTEIIIKEFEAEQGDNKELCVKLTSSSTPNPGLLLCAHSFIKTVVEIDKKVTLVEERKSQLE